MMRSRMALEARDLAIRNDVTHLWSTALLNLLIADVRQ
jgi:hypothetical protein